MVDRKVALVTGASRGIGKQLALALAEAGYDLAVVARSLERGAKLPGSLVETVAGVEALGRRALALAADLSKPEEIEGIVEATVAAFGHLDVLVNAAAFTSGRSWGAPLAELSYEAWREQYATNLDVPFLLMKAAQPELRSSGGIIVNISSAASEMTGWSDSAGAQISGTGPLAYSSSKAALNRLTNALGSPAARRGHRRGLPRARLRPHRDGRGHGGQGPRSGGLGAHVAARGGGPPHHLGPRSAAPRRAGRLGRRVRRMSAAFEMEAWELSARESCRDAIARYTHAGDRFQMADYVGVFTPDGVLEIRGETPLVGRAAIFERFTDTPISESSRRPPTIIRHNIANVLFEELSPRATRWSGATSQSSPTSVWTTWVAIATRMVPDGDAWRIAHRFVSVDWHSAESLMISEESGASAGQRPLGASVHPSGALPPVE